MPQNFIACDRDQQMLMPPDMREWLPEDHPVWFVIDSVAKLDLTGFYGRHRDDGWGRAAYDPAMMVALLLYAYSNAIRSAREIERRCVEDVAFRAITAGHRVDHATICRFRTRHRDALSELFVAVLGLCAEAGMVRTQVVAIDGTKIHANASAARNLTREQLEEFARKVFDEAERIDAEEDELYGDRRGDEIPEHLIDRKARLEWLDERLRQKEAQRAEDDYDKHMAARAAKEEELGRRLPGRKPKPKKAKAARVNTTDPDSSVQKVPQGFIQGYNGQLAVTEDQVIVAADLTGDNTDTQQLEPMIAQAQSNLKAIQDDVAIGTVVADAGYFSDNNIKLDVGAELLIPPVASRNLKEAIADRTETAEPDERAVRSQNLERDAAIKRARRRPEVMKAYIDGQVTAAEAAQVLELPVERIFWMAWLLRKSGRLPKAKIPAEPPGRSPTEMMLERLAKPGALDTYRLRGQTVEPVIGQLKEVRGLRRLLHRGCAACRCEFRMMAAAHNLRKMWVSRAGFSPLSIAGA